MYLRNCSHLFYYSTVFINRTIFMKKYILFSIVLLSIASCSSTSDDTQPETSITGVDFKQEMRDFVISISQNAKTVNPNFIIIPQNGIELVTSNGEDDGSPNTAYLSAIDGHGQEDLFYGYTVDDQATRTQDNAYLRTFLDISKNTGNTILVTDYCSALSKMDDSYLANNDSGYIGFAADDRELAGIPNHPVNPYAENNAAITELNQVKNFLYLINPGGYSSKVQFINAVTSTNYDLLIMDLFFADGNRFTADEINMLKEKANGGKRLVVSYMSIGEAEDYRYYWQTDWNTNKPSWLEAVNPDWPGNFKVKYWEPEWQALIFGNSNAYLDKIIDANFDGVYLDIIDGFEYFEK